LFLVKHIIGITRAKNSKNTFEFVKVIQGRPILSGSSSIVIKVMFIITDIYIDGKKVYVNVNAGIIYYCRL